jgi:hypothetical protein
MFEGDFEDTCTKELVRVEGQECTDPGARTPIGASGNWSKQILCAVTELSVHY